MQRKVYAKTPVESLVYAKYGYNSSSILWAAWRWGIRTWVGEYGVGAFNSWVKTWMWGSWVMKLGKGHRAGDEENWHTHMDYQMNLSSLLKIHPGVRLQTANKRKIIIYPEFHHVAYLIKPPKVDKTMSHRIDNFFMYVATFSPQHQVPVLTCICHCHSGWWGVGGIQHGEPSAPRCRSLWLPWLPRLPGVHSKQPDYCWPSVSRITHPVLPVGSNYQFDLFVNGNASYTAGNWYKTLIFNI